MARKASPNPLIIAVVALCALLLGGIVYFTSRPPSPGIAQREHAPVTPPPLLAPTHTPTPGIPAVAGATRVALPPGSPLLSAVTGLVVNSSQEILAEVRIDLIRWDSREVLSSSKTLGGHFHFGNILPGEYALRAHKPGYAVGGRAPVNLAPGVSAPLTLTLLPEAPITGEIRATVTGRRLEGATVTARLSVQSRKQHSEVAEFHKQRIALADERGYYQLKGLLPDAHYDLVVEASGYVTEERLRTRSGQAHVDFILSPGGFISGTVLVADTGEPATGAIVMALSDDRPPFETVAGEGGRYRFPGLPRGLYRLDAEWREHFAIPDERLERIFVEIGNEVEDVTVELRRGGSIHGRVVDLRSGAPVAGAALELSSAREHRASTSGAGGQFGWNGLRNGSYALKASEANYAATTAFFRIETGDRLLRDIQLVGGDALAGFVVDPAGNPVPGARVRHSLVNDRSLPVGVEQYRGETVTDSTGYFRYEGLERGVYTLLASATGYAPAHAEEVLTGSEDLRIQLTLGGRIMGTVTSVTGQPLAGIRVSLRGNGMFNQGRNLNSGETETGSDGGYQFMNLEPGNYLVSIPPTRSRQDRGARTRAVGTEGARMQMAPTSSGRQGGAVRDGATAPPSPAPPPDPWGGAEIRTRQLANVREGETTTVNFGGGDAVTLEGVVQKAGKSAGENVFVFVSEERELDLRRLRSDAAAMRRTGPDGSFVVYGLRPETRYYVLASRSFNHVPVVKEIETPGSGTRRVVLSLPQTRVRGWVLDAFEQPVAGAFVGLESRDEDGDSLSLFDVRRWRRSCRTEATGGFEIDEVPPGEYNLRVSKERTTLMTDLTVQERGTTTARVVLQNGGTLQGTITGAGLDAGSRLSMVFMFEDVQTGASFGVPAYRGVEEGKYELTDLHPGRYHITCSAMLREGVLAPAVARNVAIIAGQTTRRDFALEPGISLRLSFRDEAGEPLRGVRVEVRDGYGNPVKSGVVRMGESYNTWSATLQRRVYRFELQKPGFKEMQLRLNLRESDPTVTRDVQLVRESAM